MYGVPELEPEAGGGGVTSCCVPIGLSTRVKPGNEASVLEQQSHNVEIQS